MALQKGSKLYSIVKFKCPQCQEGDFFISHPYDFKNMGKPHEHCSECGMKLSKEPGFYFGAMYVSYAFGVALFVVKEAGAHRGAGCGVPGHVVGGGY